MDVDSNRKKTLLIICATEFFTCFAFFGMLSLLILFFVRQMGLPEKISYSMLGNFASLSYISALIGGFLGGRYLTFRFTCLVGLILFSIGYFLLMYDQQMMYIDTGLTLIACGGGLFEPNIRILLGIHYNQCTTEERNTGFTLLHVFNICGQVSGPIVLTCLDRIKPSWMFAASGVACVFGIITFLINYQHISKFSTAENNKTSLEICQGLFGIILLIAFVFFVLYERDVKYVLETVFIGAFITFFIILPRADHVIRTKIMTVFLILSGLVVTEICFRQISGVINLFTMTYINRTVFHITIPTGIFQSTESFFILVVFAWVLRLRKKLEEKGCALSSGTSISLGLFSLSIAFGCLVFGISVTVIKMPVIWLILSYAVMAIGELFTIPIATAATTALSPPAWRGAMMGVFFLSGGLSSYLSGHVGKLISPKTGNPSLSVYKNLFSVLTVFAAVSAVALYLIWKYWRKKHSAELPEKI